jgi:hypothetical protein
METPDFWRDMEAPDFRRRAGTPDFRRDMEPQILGAGWKPQILGAGWKPQNSGRRGATWKPQFSRASAPFPSRRGNPKFPAPQAIKNCRLEEEGKAREREGCADLFVTRAKL